jgi:phenylpropionate dioxygenase-like ring-hydroxylating dioxygenase large terminal subunit
MDYSTLMENVMDVSHVNFTHHNSVGGAGAAAGGLLQNISAVVSKDWPLTD